VANLNTGRRLNPLLWLLFGFSGRISRAFYWASLAGIYCINLALFIQLERTAAEERGVITFVMLVISLAALVANLAIAAKRLHDFGKDGRYSLLLLLPALGLVALIATGGVGFVQVASLVTLGATIWFGVPPSEPGPNRYGDGPNIPRP
jgi:uncharacterized membrane protein YhaH (DUF805 family)